MSEDKQWASKYLLDPLTAPEPRDETGPGTSFRTRDAETHGKSKIDSDNRRPQSASRAGYPTPPTSASPTSERFLNSSPLSSKNPFIGDGQTRGRALDDRPIESSHRRRGSSLTARFPGDQSHRPLNILRQDAKKASRAPHLRKKHIPGPDSIDALDMTGFSYHHEGPYDATLLARNIHAPTSPVAAVQSSNAKAIQATPAEKVRDSLLRHRPLDGVSMVPPGARDLSGKMMMYEEGSNLMVEGGYKRWPGLNYHPDDIKGKAEPSYSIEEALKADSSRSHRRVMSDGDSAYEMHSRARPSSAGGAEGMRRQSSSHTPEWEDESRPGHSHSLHLPSGLKRRFNSLRTRRAPHHGP